MSSAPRVSVIVVSWNVVERLSACLASLADAGKETDLEVIVVDNASRDGSASLVERKFPHVRLLRQQQNLGFARAVNVGIRVASGEDLFLLNPDATVEPETIPELLRFLEQNPDVGIVGPAILGDDGLPQESVRRFPTLADQAVILAKLDHLWPGIPANRRYLYADLDRSQPQRVDQVKGAAFLFRRAVLDAIGLFDEGFFLWFEEVDYCRRAFDAGWGTAYDPAARVRHAGGRSFQQRLSVSKHRFFLASERRYFRQHRPRIEQVLLAPFLVVSYLLHVLATPFHPR